VKNGAGTAALGGRWNDPEGFYGILKRLESSKPGDIIHILAHPDWWGSALNLQVR
jgi:hypothetical protein